MANIFNEMFNKKPYLKEEDLQYLTSHTASDRETLKMQVRKSPIRKAANELSRWYYEHINKTAH